MQKIRTLAVAIGVLLAQSALADNLPAADVTRHKEDQHAIPAAEHTVTGNVTLASQYIYRGLSQTNGKPALQGGLDYAHVSGFYAGTWLSSISWFTDQNANTAAAPVALSSPGATGAPYLPNKSNSANLEWDVYAGIKNSFAGDWTYDVGLLTSNYPGIYENLGAYRKPDTAEVYAALGYQWLALKYSKAVSHYTFGVNESRGASYIDLAATIPLPESGVTLQAHAGHQKYPGNANAGYWGASGGNNSYFDYTDYKLGLTREYRGFTYGLAWTHANSRSAAPDNQTTAYMNAFGSNIGGSRATVSVTRNF